MACIYGKGAFPAAYTANSCLMNIAGTLVGGAFQTFILSDSNRPHIHGSHFLLYEQDLN